MYSSIFFCNVSLTILKLIFLNILFFSFSGKYVRFNRDEVSANENYQLFFQILSNQEVYNFTLNAQNLLGQTESTLLVNITEKGKLLHKPVS